jgi:DNA-binding LacI/PurR family transcriptional regulator
MRDVATLAGVSQSTVSRVLNQTASTSVPISEETTQRVFAAVKQLGYHPNLTARSLRGQKTQLIGMMIADICNPYYQVMVRSVQDVARARGYDVLISNTDHDPDTERSFPDSIIRRPVDGVILTPYFLSLDEVTALIDRTGVSVVTLGTYLGHPQVDAVFADDERATHEATQWLIRERRHERIAYIAVPGTHPSLRRVRGFERAMFEAGLAVPREYIAAGDFEFESGARAMRDLLKLPAPPTAVIACNDLMALGALMTAESLGYEVPDHVAVLGFDNIPEAARSWPKLTTIAQYPREMGERLATALFERIEGQELGLARTYEVPCRLIVRESA